MDHVPWAVVVERTPLCRRALAQLLTTAGANVLTSTRSLKQGLCYARIGSPGLAVLDADICGERSIGGRLVRVFAHAAPRARTVLAYAEHDQADLQEALAAGAAGCFMKNDGVEIIEELLRGVLSEITGPVDVKQPSKGAGAAGDHPVESRMLAGLTPRELEVLRHIARGSSVLETSEILCLSPKTVDHYKTKLMAKLGVHDKVTLARLAIREGEIPVWD